MGPTGRIPIPVGNFIYKIKQVAITGKRFNDIDNVFINTKIL
jgi:hypothetical protein